MTIELRRRKYQPNIAGICDVVGEISGTNKKNTGEVANEYFKFRLPVKIAEIKGNSPNDASNVLKRGHIDRDTIIYVMEEIAVWDKFDPELARTVMDHVIPSVLSFSDIRKSSSDKLSNTLALVTMTKKIGEGKLEVMSPLCPPYSYREDPNTKLLSHASGEIIPSIGPRFPISVSALKEAFLPVARHNVDVTFQFLSYTGETGDPSDLIEMGQDVMTHYRGNESQLFNNLREAKNEALHILSGELSATGIHSEFLSIEYIYSETIKNVVKKVGEMDPGRAGGALSQILNISENWLRAFVAEELAYRKKQGTLINDEAEPVVTSALKEGLLYLFLTNSATNNGRIIIDLETTSNYMATSLETQPGPVLIASPYNKYDPWSKTDISQPFNLPS